MKVKEKMNTKFITANKNDDIYIIAKKMKEYNIGFLPICDNGKIVGVLTDRDIVVDMLANKDIHHIESYMKKKMITIDAEEDLQSALQIMKKEKIKRLLVTKEQKIIAVLSLSDIIDGYDAVKEIANTVQTIFKKQIALREQTAQINAFEL